MVARTSLIGLTLAAAAAAHSASPSAPVRLAEAVAIEASERLWVPGTVLSRSDAELSAEVPGRLMSVAEAGSRVAAGDVVARIRDRTWQLDRAGADAEIRRLDAHLAYLDKEVERLARLTEADSAARSQLDELVARRAMAAQERAAARTERERALDAIERARIVAPFPGQIVERLAEPGEFATAGRAVVRLVHLDDREVRARAPLRLAPFVQERAEVDVRAGELRRTLPVTTIIPVGDLASRSFELRIRLPERTWAIGTPVEVGLPTGAPRRVTAVPRDALVLRSGGAVVYRVDGEGVAERMPVETGIGADELIEVRGDIRPGDRVVVRGAEMLRDGAPVRAVGAEESGGGS